MIRIDAEPNRASRRIQRAGMANSGAEQSMAHQLPDFVHALEQAADCGRRRLRTQEGRGRATGGHVPGGQPRGGSSSSTTNRTDVRAVRSSRSSGIIK